MLHQIGAGVLGPVFRAYQPDPGRLVAIKQFRLDLEPDTETRFLDALQQIVAADLTHQGIAAPIAAGMAEAAPYLALDFVAAESFDVVMREHGPAQAREALRLARQVGSALDSAAAVGVLHGALHPRDVLMAADDVRVTGLGIAQALDSIGVTAPIRRPYAAPERAAGAPWDRRADTFGLAALVYEMLVGRRVTRVGDVAESLTAVHGCDTDRLRAVFARGLAEDPAERFESAREFSDALNRALTPAPSHAKSSAARRRRGAGAPSEGGPLVAELPLEAARDPDSSTVDADTRDDALEMSLLDAAMPPLEHGEAYPDVQSDVALSEPDLGDPDLDRVDTRLDAVPVPAALTDLDFRTIEGGRFEHTDTTSSVAVPTLRLDALDQETDAPPAAFNTPVVRDPADLSSKKDDEDLAREVAAAGSVYGTPFGRSTPLGASDGQGSGNWPIYLGVAVGLLVGFAFGYSYGLWRVTGSVLSGATLASSELAVQPVPAAPRPQAPPIAPVPAPSAPAAPALAASAASRPAASSAQTPERGASPSPRPAAPATVPSTARGARAASAPAIPAVPPPNPQPPRPATDTRVVVRTTPAGARVTIDGRDVGITPLTTANLSPGSHVVRLAHQGYAGAERRVRIGAAQPVQPIDVELVARPAREIAAAPVDPGRASGSLVLDSRPAGARVFVDEALVGTTPLQIDAIAGGDHAVRFELDGFDKWSTTAHVTAGTRTRVSGSLER